MATLSRAVVTLVSWPAPQITDAGTPVPEASKKSSPSPRSVTRVETVAGQSASLGESFQQPGPVASVIGLPARVPLSVTVKAAPDRTIVTWFASPGALA